MCYTLFRVYREPGGERKEKEASKPPKGVILEHLRAEFIIYHYQLEGDQSIINREICWDFRDTSRPF